MSKGKIQAVAQGGVCGALVWRAEGKWSQRPVHISAGEMGVCSDVYRLRVEWRVVGGLVGALPVQPRQSGQLGLPLHLSPEELSHLLEKGRTLFLFHTTAIHIPFQVYWNWSRKHLLMMSSHENRKPEQLSSETCGRMDSL